MSKWLVFLMLVLLVLPGICREGQEGFHHELFSDDGHRALTVVGDDYWSREIDFIRYLVGRGEYRESLFLLNRLNPGGQERMDSLNYLKGWVHYREKSLEVSAEYLLKVSAQSPAFPKSRFFAAYNLAHAGDAGSARCQLESFEPDLGLHAALRRFQLGGVALLERDFESYPKYASDFSGGYHVMTVEERRMNEHYRQLLDSPSRSPFVAGMLSAAVPGLGKVYAGKTTEGIAGFLYVTALGLTAFDFYRGSGPGSLMFVLSASAAGVFYIGNITGSVTAVRRANKEFNHEMDQRILFDMHIPLRNAF